VPAVAARSAAWADVRALLVDELLSKNVRVATVLGKLAQHVEIHPPQRKRAPPVPAKDVVQIQG
jgi:hypothetical protein